MPLTLRLGQAEVVGGQVSGRDQLSLPRPERSGPCLLYTSLSDFGGRVPRAMEDLLKLPGVGRKTANLIQGDVFHEPGVVVADTHCIRISGRLGLTDGTKDPAKVEKQLRAVLPPEESNDFCHRLVLHGRAVCTARTAKCELCPLCNWCDHFQRHAADSK